MLKRFWEAWKRIAHKIGSFQARVVLTVLYGVLVLPFGLVVRWFSDPLRIKRRPQGWLEHAENPNDLEWAHRQW
jgi:hypothetical protein